MAYLSARRQGFKKIPELAAKPAKITRSPGGELLAAPADPANANQIVFYGASRRCEQRPSRHLARWRGGRLRRETVSIYGQQQLPGTASPSPHRTTLPPSHGHCRPVLYVRVWPVPST